MEGALFAVFPYVALVLAVLVGIYRYFSNRFSYSSISSELLEKRMLFWGSVPWHYAIVLILLAHLGCGLFPFAARPVFANFSALAALEVAGWALGLFSILGIVVLMARRIPARSLARPSTSVMDWVLLIVLLVQVVTGVGIAMFLRWGSRWYLSAIVPWFWSIFRMQPDASSVVPLPLLAKLHAFNGFVVILLFPFTRLVHIFTVPITYLWRPYQVVVWNRPPGGFVPPAGGDAPPVQAGANGGDTRRRFLSGLTTTVGGISALLVAVPSVWFLLGGLRKVPMAWRTVGRVDDFQIGKTVEVAFEDPSPLPWSGVTARTAAWLRRHTADQFLAFSVNCTHLGCPVRWLPDADLFMCPCHGGVFYNDGSTASGPPPRPLVKYPVRVQDGLVQILTSPVPIA